MMKPRPDEAATSPKRGTDLDPAEPQSSLMASANTEDSQNDPPAEKTMLGNTRSAPKKMSRIRTVEEGRACLIEAQLVKSDDTLDVNTLAGALVHISFLPGMSQATKDAVCMVAILLAQIKLTSEAATPTKDFMDWVVDKLAGVVKMATQAAVEEIKQALNALAESSTQTAASATSYWDALKNMPISITTLALTVSLDARVHARRE